jgi:thiosulfate/3-mercaptopyruvate sulfurtransferase
MIDPRRLSRDTGMARRAMLALPWATAAAMLSAGRAHAAPAGWNDTDLMEPKTLADRVRPAAGQRPVVLFVGFNVMYRNKHIPGAVFAGPGSTAEGVAALKKAVASIPKSSEIVLYCGCCPWAHCPNMKPAFAALKAMGYGNVKALMLESNFAKDWVDKGYPAEKGSAAG